MRKASIAKTRSRFEALARTVPYALALSLASYVCWHALPPGFVFDFSWHPFLMSLAYLLLITPGMLVISFPNAAIESPKRSDNVLSHLGIQMLVTLLGQIAFGIIWTFKESNNKEHYTTWHGFMGMLVSLFGLVQAVFGLPLYFPALRTRFSPSYTKSILMHRACGIANYAFGGATLVLALYSNWFAHVSKGSPLAFSLMLTGIVTLYGLTAAALVRKFVFGAR